MPEPRDTKAGKSDEETAKVPATEQEYEHQEEIGSTSGRRHEDILRQTLPREEARKSALRKERSRLEP